MKSKRFSAWRFTVGMCLCVSIGHAGLVETVINTSDSNTGSLREAIILVDDGGYIFFSDDVFGDTITLTSGSLAIDKNIHIIGPGADQLLITSNNQFRIFHLKNNTTVTISNLGLFKGKVRFGTLDRDSKGGGIYSEGRLTLEACKISHCSSTIGGAVYADTLYLYECNISNNIGIKNGGGIYCHVLEAHNSSISNNIAPGRYETVRLGQEFRKGCAGGIYGHKAITLNQCTIAENSCTLHGGGLYLDATESSTLLNIISSTITNNNAEVGGGIYETNSIIEHFSNNIIGSNTASMASDDFYHKGIFSNPALVNNNIIGISDNPILIPGLLNQIGTTLQPIDALLDSLAYNGGPTPTNAITQCSPAIDAGHDTGYSLFDQRGIDRKIGSAIDIGPFEYEDPNNQDCVINPFISYTIITEKKAELNKSNVIIHGGVGVLENGGEAKIDNNSMIIGPSTFVKAIDIDISGNSIVTYPIYETPDIILPDFLYNDKDSKMSIKIEDGETMILTDSIYKKIEVGESATVIFKLETIYVQDLILKDFSKLEITSCTDIIIEDLLDIKKHCVINMANNGLKVYAQHVHIEEGSRITANLYTSTHIRVKGDVTSPTMMKGQFLGEEIEGDDHVVWDWNINHFCPGFIPPEEVEFSCDSLIVDAGIDKAVIIGKKQAALKKFSCVLLNSNVQGGTAPYTYSWSPSVGLNDASLLLPEACPTEDTEYELTVIDANGCIQKDKTTIAVYNLKDIRNLPNCGGGLNKVEVCDISSNTTRCVNIFALSENNGLGPQLNSGSTLGPCSNIRISKETNNKSSQPFSDYKIWPNPSRGETFFSIPIYQNESITLLIYDSSGQKINHVENILEVKNNSLTIAINNLDRGFYFYQIESNSNRFKTGKFLIID